MKRILITGASSYVGTSFKKWVQKYRDKYSVNSISLRNERLKELNFSQYDVVFHVAGIAHQKETKNNAKLYYKINRDLAYETALKAKEDGVKHFVFLSSMSVYGIDNGVIKKNSELNPKSNYGKSKLEAEVLIKKLEGPSFKVAILRPPIIYGKNCKGNYPKLANLATKIPFFPDVNNRRSMIFIDNFSEFVRLVIDNCSNGYFYPQNKEYVKTSNLVKLIAESHGKSIRMTHILNPLINLIQLEIVRKIFGDLVYEQGMSNLNGFSPIPFEETIKLTEMNIGRRDLL